MEKNSIKVYLQKYQSAKNKKGLLKSNKELYNFGSE
jgi:hypothetical protein